MNRVRVTLPYHLRNLAKVDMEVELQVPSPVTQRSILSSLEAAYPVLVGTTRDSITHRRRPLVRFFACGQDLSLESPDAPLPDLIASGDEPYMIIGAIAGG